MAPEKQRQAPAIADFLDDEPWTWDFFQAVRRIEAQSTDKPRIGCSVRPDEDPVRFGQEPTLAFPPTAIAALRRQDDLPPQLVVHFLGLLGCNGPMPLNLTEYVRQRRNQDGDGTLAAFLDMFHHRMISLFYRAWAIHQQTASFDRGEDAFAGYVASLIGIGMPSLKERDTVPDNAKLHVSGHLSCPTAHAAGLEAIVQGYFGIKASVVQFVGQWLALPEAYRCRLGESSETGRIGGNLTVGSRVYSCQHRFRIRLGPMRLHEYMRFLPGSQSLRQLVDWVRNYCGLHLEWDVQLVLKAEDVPKTQLGQGQGARLGYTTWLQSSPPDQDADPLILGPFDSPMGSYASS